MRPVSRWSMNLFRIIKEEIVAFARRCGFPVVAKVVGPVHKSDVGGVVLNIKSEQHLGTGI